MRCVLPLSLLIVSSPAAAQTPWSPWSPSTPEPAVTVPEPPPARLREPSLTFMQRTTRIALELLGASIGAGASLGVGVGLGCGLDHGRCRGDGSLPAVLALGAFGVPAGVTLAGSLAGGNGGYGWSVLGEFGGVLLAIPIALLSERRPGFAVAAAIVLPIAGAVVGFEVSSDNAPVRPRATGMRWAPALSVSTDGAMVGAAGVF